MATTNTKHSMRTLLVAGLAAALPSTAAWAAKPSEVPRGLLRMTPDQIAERVEIRDDPLEAKVKFSTQPVLRKGGLMDGVAVRDGFLIAEKARDSGETNWIVRHDISYLGAHRDLHLVHLQSGAKLKTIAPSNVRRWVEDCPDTFVTCNQHLTVEFQLPEPTVREIAAAYRAGDTRPWPVRLKDRNGQDVTVGIAPAEVAGLVKVVDRWAR